MKKIFVAGHRGMVGSAIVRTLRAHGQADIITRSHSELDLTNQAAVRKFFEKERPEQVYLAAAKVGGIFANANFPADFIYQNLMIEANVIEASFRNGIKNLLFLGSSCIYPKLASQPMREDALLSGILEPTNEAYAIAKIAGIKLCESYNQQYGASHGLDYRCVMPSNLYGPGDNYHPENSHVIPALIRRIHQANVTNASSVTIWGSGTPKREFLHVNDLAEACVFVMNLDQSVYKKLTTPRQSHINVGGETEITILNLARAIAAVIGYKGEIHTDPEKPDGPPRKFMDSSVIKSLGWMPRISFTDGLRTTYDDFLTNLSAD